MTEDAAKSDGEVEQILRDKGWVDDGNMLLAIHTGVWDADDLDSDTAPERIRRQLEACDGEVALMLPASSLEPYRRWVWFDGQRGWLRTDEARVDMDWQPLRASRSDLRRLVGQTIRGGETPVPVLTERMPPKPVREAVADE